MDGATDGIPEYLLQQQYALPWLEMVRKEIRKIRKRRSDINPYGGTSETEFFAVASEYFFQRPDQFREKHPQLFEAMEEIFRQDLDEDGHIGEGKPL